MFSSWQAARWGARGAADTLAVRHTRRRRGDALGRALASWVRRTCPAAPSVVGWAVLHSAARRCASLFETCLRLLRALGTLGQPSAPLSTLVITPWHPLCLCRWRSHGGVLRTATLAYLALLQRVGCSAARRVLYAWCAAADLRCAHRAHAPRAAAHRRQARLACGLGCWVACTAAAAMARRDLVRGARGAMLRVVASWRARAAARRASCKIMAEVEPLAQTLGLTAVVMFVVTTDPELTPLTLTRRSCSRRH